jgi:hypothetical protein
MVKKQETAAEPRNSFDDFGIGDQVQHPKWGVGTILFRSGSGDAAKVIVVFPEEGQKKLALKYAKLKKLHDGKRLLAETPPLPKAVEEKPPLKIRSGEDEVFLTDRKGERIFMRAVRDDAGALVGYYERYEVSSTE